MGAEAVGPRDIRRRMLADAELERDNPGRVATPPMSGPANIGGRRREAVKSWWC